MSKDIVKNFQVDSELWKKAGIYSVEHEITIRDFIESSIMQELEERQLEEKLNTRRVQQMKLDAEKRRNFGK